MRLLLQHRGLRFIFIANLVSMIGSGMNTAAVTWFILKDTNSEVSLSALVVLQTVPALVMLPFTGVIIDREDRRRLVMLLDACVAQSSPPSRCSLSRTVYRSGISMPWARRLPLASGCFGRRSRP